MGTSNHFLAATKSKVRLLFQVTALMIMVVASTRAATISAIKHFDASIGSDSRSDLVLGPDGLLYGATRLGGGVSTTGVIFKVTTSGVLTPLVSFTGPGGSQPQGGFAFAPDGQFYGIAYQGGANGYGTVWRANTNGGGNVLADFNAANGAYPIGGVTRASDGNFYGTAFSGVFVNSFGCVFKLTPGGVMTTLASISNAPPHGKYPYAGVTQAGDGHLYGVAHQGGSSELGAVFRVTLGGALTTLASFTGANGSTPLGALTLGTDGNLYGVTQLGGGNNLGTVFKVTTGGVLTTAASFLNATTDGSGPVSALVQGADGNFYGTTTSGGASGDGAVFRMTPAGVLTRLASFSYSATGASPWGRMTFGPDGNLYGTTQYGGANNRGTVYRVSGLAPAVGTQPVGTNLIVGANATMSVTALGSAPLAYQWRLNGVPVSGATNSSLALSNVNYSQQGGYTVVITNSSGSVTSTVAVLGVKPAGVTHWWPGEGNGNDVIGGLNGTGMGGLSYTGGRLGSAFNLNGTSAYLQVPSHASLLPGTGSFTLEAWIKTAGQVTPGEAGEIFSMYDCGGNCDGPSWYTFYMNADGIPAAILRDSNDTLQQTHAGATFNDNAWHHLVMTRDLSAGEIRLYVDGVQRITTPLTVTGPIVDAGPEAEPLFIGASRLNSSTTTGGYFAGQLDDLAYYNRRLIDEEVNLLYRASAGLPFIITQPTSRTNDCGPTNVTFAVVAGGVPPLGYQWRRNGGNIPSATNASFTITNTSPGSAGNYTVVVTNASGSITSSVAVLAFGDVAPPIIACSTNITVNCNPTGTITAVSYTVTATDACDPAPTVVCTPPSANGFTPGTTTVNCLATDASGNSNGCSFTVTVINPAHTDTMISAETGTYAGGWILGDSQTYGVSWTQTRTYVNATIAANLDTLMPGVTGVAYLTTRIGPGTTSGAHQVAQAPFAVWALNGEVPVIKGVTLLPGTYYLTLRVTVPIVSSDTSWRGTSTPVPVLDSGVIQNGDFAFIGAGVDPYPPASNFGPTGNTHLRYSVRGMPISAGMIWAEDVTVNESSGNAVIRVILSAPQTNTVRFDYGTQDGSAKNGPDYVSRGGSVTFNPGETNTTIAVSIANGAIAEPVEHFFLNLWNPVNATLGRAQATATILDDDAPAVGFSSTWLSPVEGGTYVMGSNISVQLQMPNPPVAQPLRFRVLDGTNLLGLPYSLDLPATATWEAGASWTPTNAGAHTLRAVIEYDNGTGYAIATSAPVNITVVAPPMANAVTLLNFNSNWRYDASTNDLGTAWKDTNFNDAAWSGPSPGLFYNETAPLPETPNTFLPLTTNGARIRGFYFRTQFVFSNNPVGATLTASNLIDDGAVFYLNGTEVGRLRMTNNPVVRTSLASATPPTPGGDATNYETLTLVSSPLRQGTNTLAVEVHQVNDGSSDIVFGMRLDALPGFAPSLVDPTQPTNRVVIQNRSSTLSAAALASPPVTWRWFKGASLIATSTNSADYVISNMTAALAGSYRCIVSNNFGSVTSRTATVGYFADEDAPQLLSAVGSANLTAITLAFSEPLDPASATSLANYTLSPALGGAPLAILGATLSSSSTVTLITAARSACVNYAVIVNNVLDLAGNPITPDSQATVASSFVVVPADNHLWSYFQSNTDPGAGWQSPGFNDTAEWCVGPAAFDAKFPPGRLQVGAGNVPVRTLLNLTNPPGASEVTRTYYFRTHFRLPGPPANGARLLLRSLVDDGAIFYLNGVEVRRVRMPAAPAPISYLDFANVTVSDPNPVFEGPVDLPVGALVEGDNVLAVEVHQINAGSSDITFAAELSVVLPAYGPPAITAPNIVTNCASGAGLALSFAPTVVSNAACTPPVSIACTPPSGSLFPLGLTTVFCSATSGANLYTSISFTVLVRAAVNGAEPFPASDGRDGDYVPAGTGTTFLAGGTYYFGDFIIPAGLTVNVTGPNPLRVHALRKIEVHGSLIANGGNGGNGAASASPGGAGGVAAAGGGAGGAGGSRVNGIFGGANGFGFGGGAGAQLQGGSIPGGGGGGGLAAMGFSGSNGTCCVARCGAVQISAGAIGGSAYGSNSFSTLLAGSGGGGGSAGGADDGSGAGGGGGGGAIYLEGMSVFVNTTGTIRVNGGNGGGVIDGSDGSAGGGGSGGSIWLRGLAVTNRGSLQSTGGLGGITVIGGSCGFPGAGGGGAVGRIRQDGVTLTNSGSVTPGAFTSIINFNDITPPALNCSNILVPCNPTGLTIVTYTVTATDLCDPAPGLVCVPPSGSAFPAGSTPVTCTTWDASHNTNTCTFTVTVLPVTPAGTNAPAFVWQQSYGGTGDEVPTFIRQTSDGGFLVGGYSDSPVSGNKTNAGFGGLDGWVLRLDAAGNRLWERSYGGSGEDQLWSVEATADGGFILAGWSGSPGGTGNKTASNRGGVDGWVLKIDANGNPQWDVTYGGVNHDQFFTIKPTATGYIVGGFSASGATGNKTTPAYGGWDYYVLRLDSNGGRVWEQTFGGAGTSNNDELYDIAVASDGGFLLIGESLGQTGTGTKTSPNRGGYDGWAIRVDGNGVKQWEQTYGGANDDGFFRARATSDGGFLIGGWSASAAGSGNKTSPAYGDKDYWLVKVDATGSILWQQSYGGAGRDDIYELVMTPDGGCLVAGLSSSGASGNKTTPGNGGDDSWVLRLDSAGNKRWEISLGGTSHDNSLAAAALSGGGYVVAVDSRSVPSGNKTAPNYGAADFWITRLALDAPFVPPVITTAPAIVWQQSFGGANDDRPTVMRPTADGGFIVGGYSSSGASGSKTSAGFGSYDYWLIRLDAAGNRLWERSYGGTGEDILTAAEQTSDGGFILAGWSDSGATGNKTNASFGALDVWIVKTDASGNMLWNVAYGGDNWERAYSVKQLPDGGYVVGAESASGVSGNKTSPGYGGWDYYLLRLNSSGGKLWERTYGGGSTANPNDELYDVAVTASGGFLLAGYSASDAGTGTKTSPNRGGIDGWLISVDANGTKLWEQSYGGAGLDLFRKARVTPSGGILLAGTSDSPPTSGNKTRPAFGGVDDWVLQVDGTGNIVWEQTYGGTGNDEALGLELTPDGGCLIIGFSTSGVSGNKAAPGNGGDDGWILRLDSMGNRRWEASLGGSSEERSSSATVLPNGGYVVASYSASGVSGNKTSPNYGGSDFWITRLADDAMPDTFAPIITCPTNRTVACAGASGTPVTFSASAVDNCDPNVLVVCVPPSGAAFPLGTNVVNCTATDSAGNSNSCSFTISMEDSPSTVEKWVRGYDGPGHTNDLLEAVAMDDNGNVAVTGISDSGSNLLACYTAKYSANTGSLLWARRDGQGFYGNGTDVALDSAGNVVIVGLFYGVTGRAEGYTAKYASANGSLLWEQRYSSASNEATAATSIAIDQDGNVAVTGVSRDIGMVNNIYTAKYAATNGALLWIRRGNFDGAGKKVKFDATGNVVVVGTALGTNSQADYYTAKYAAGDGALVWEQRYNGPAGGYDGPTDVAVDAAGNVFVTGSSFNSTNSFTDLIDYHTVKYAGANGMLLWERRYDGPVNRRDEAKAMALDAQGDVVVTGASQRSVGGGFDFYTAKYKGTDGAILWQNRYHSLLSLSDKAGGVAVDSMGDVIVAGDSDGMIGSSSDLQMVKLAGGTGVLMAENRYSGPAQASDYFARRRGLAVASGGQIALAGSSGPYLGQTDYLLVMYGPTLAPAITCPSNILITCAGNGGTVATYVATAVDHCDPDIPVICVPPSGTVFALGTNLVTCTSTDSGGHTSSCSFTVTVLNDGVVPIVTSQPQSRTNIIGTTASFTAAGIGCPAPAYQWWRGATPLTNGPDISGVNSATLVLARTTQAGSAGSYSVVLSNSFGSITSTVATLTLVAPTTNGTALAVTQDGWVEAVSTAAGVVLYGGTGPQLHLASPGTPWNLQWIRKTYLGFDNANAPALATSFVHAASLSFRLGTNIHPSFNSSGAIRFFGVRQDNPGRPNGLPGDNRFNETTLTWTNAPGNRSNDVVFSTDVINGVVLGEVAVPAVTSNALLTVTSQALLEYIAGSTNGFLTVAAVYLGQNDNGYNPVPPEGMSIRAKESGVGPLLSLVVAPTPLPATIARQPQSLAVYPGGTATISVGAAGSPPFTYQWSKGGAAIAGATNKVLTFSNVQPADVGSYSVEVCNAGARVGSSNATLQLLPAAVPGGYESFVGLTTPLCYWRFSEPTGGTVITNRGTLGAAANGTVVPLPPIPGITLGAVGARPPALGGFEANNTAGFFDGANGYINAPALNLNTNTATFVAWVKRNGAQSDTAHILSMRKSGSYDNAGLHFSALGTGLPHNLRYTWADHGSTYNWDSGLVVPDNEWTLVALVVEPNRAVIYCGTSSGLGRATNVVQHYTMPFSALVNLGRDGRGDRFFKGCLDEVAIYARALSATEIETLYTARLTPQPPLITSQPQPAQVRVPPDPQAMPLPGTNFSVAAGSITPLRYQWQFNGQNISGANSSVLTLTNIQLSDEGDYRCAISNDVGGVLSDSARLFALITPVIVEAPWSQSVVAGSPVTVRAVITGHPAPFGFLWRSNAVPIGSIVGSARTNVFTFNASTNPGISSTYRLIVTNLASPVASPTAPNTTFIITTLLDSDGDGLPNSYETAIGLNPNNPGDAFLDPDGDGMSMVDEYLAGTDPYDVNSYLRIDQVSMPGMSLVQVAAVSNRTYTVQFKDDLASPSWSRLVDLIARPTNRVEIIKDPAPSDHRIYRLALPMQP